MVEEKEREKLKMSPAEYKLFSEFREGKSDWWLVVK